MIKSYSNETSACQQIINQVGKKLVIGVPLGIGKPIRFLNAIYRLAEADPSIDLTIITGLTLAKPQFHQDLEARLGQPIVDRLFKDYENPLYEEARLLQKLPKNINVIEFFLTPGMYLHNDYVQQHYISTMYTNVVRDTINLGINIIAQQVAISDNYPEQYSLSCNTDLFSDVVAHFKQVSKPFMVVAEINKNLPFMLGEKAVYPDSQFNIILNPQTQPALYVLPREELSTQDHLIGLYASTLIKDDACLQIGIGKLNNAVANAVIFRHQHNSEYQNLLNAMKVTSKFGDLINTVGDLHSFKVGLNASTEMLSDDYMELYKANILTKKISGKILEAGFFIGSQALYDFLNQLDAQERQLFEMTNIAQTNRLNTNSELPASQRINARFINAAMMVSLTGAVISDGLANSREVSGVGGQFDFVYMSNQLKDARNIILCRSTRISKQGLESNIVWDYPNLTIPRFFRDIIITEYGIADCRGKTDSDVIKNILNITDSRFQHKLLDLAKKYGKIAADYQIPETFCNNFIDNYAHYLEPYQKEGSFKAFPFGSELTEEEQVLQRVLLALNLIPKYKIILTTIFHLFSFRQNNFDRYLQRMNLTKPQTLSEYFYKRILLTYLPKFSKNY